MKGATDDYKNFARNVRMFISDMDAQLVIEKMKDWVEHLPNYTFKYSMENGEIRHMFWADEISKVKRLVTSLRSTPLTKKTTQCYFRPVYRGGQQQKVCDFWSRAFVLRDNRSVHLIANLIS
ncbi:hypothetical protein HanPI659440_Chr03g0128891 [Helianthus annuus]|nr:hypothetical protein HanPI659440_Chr03g0128891 [Helianthus annuus]